MRRGGDVDRVIQRIARAHNRVVPWHELRATGVAHRMVEHRVAVGRLYRHHTGVYLLDPPDQVSRLTLLSAAVAACGPAAVLSHACAAELWGLLPGRPGDIDVTVIGRNPGLRPGIRRHRSRTLTDADIRTKRGIRVTSPARTMLDGALCLRPDVLEEMVANGLATGLVDERKLQGAIARAPNHRGVGRLEALLSQDGGPKRTRSENERRLLSLIRQAGLPIPMTNVLLHGHQVDALWPEQRLVVEVDSYKYHGDRSAFRTDRARDAVHVAKGYRVLRFTAEQLRDEPLVVIGQIAAALALSQAA